MDFRRKPRVSPPKPLEVLKNNILSHYAIKQQEITKRQHQYFKAVTTKVQSRKATLHEMAHSNKNKQLTAEKEMLKAKIWVATGAEHLRNSHNSLQTIQCHIQCQERLATDIRRTKSAIMNMKRDLSRIVKKMYALNRQTVPEMQHQQHVAQARKQLQILENRLEVRMRRECDQAAENAKLREEIIKMMFDRMSFNEMYTKVVQRLNSDKKYLIDVLDCTMAKIEGCNELYEKMEMLNKRNRRESDLRKMEMQTLVRHIQSNKALTDFFNTNERERSLDDLQPKEYRRREALRQKYSKKINLYNDILNKILDYTKSEDVEKVQSKFQEQEGAYYSYFSYANELSYHMTLLNNAVNRLYGDIEGLKLRNRNTMQEEIQIITGLELELQNKKKKNEELQRVKENNETHLRKLMESFQLIQNQCEADTEPLNALLGQHEVIDLRNMRRFLQLIERRVYDVVAIAYIDERMVEPKNSTDYVVKEVDKICEWPTDLNEIVLTQQCPECAEVETFNVDDSVDGLHMLSMEEVRKKLHEKVPQPEMQYRLHSVSQCRLPRSRNIAAKKQRRL